MSRIACCLLACAMVVTTAMSMAWEPDNEHWNIGPQCVKRGPFSGACKRQNNVHDELRCSHLACALRREDGSYLAVYTGPVVSGTICGKNKVCEDGVCVSKNPFEIKFLLGEGRKFDCLSPPPREIPEYPPHESGVDEANNRPAIEKSSLIGGRPYPRGLLRGLAR